MNMIVKPVLFWALLTCGALAQAQTQPTAAPTPMPSTAPVAAPTPAPAPPASAPSAPRKQVARPAPNTAATAAPTTNLSTNPPKPPLPPPPPSLPPSSQITLDMYNAYAHGNLELADMLLKQGADINCNSCGGPPLLFRAIFNYNWTSPDMIAWVLTRGGNPSVTWIESDSSKSALMEYIQRIRATLPKQGVTNLMMLKRMLDAGGDARARTASGQTVLHFLSTNAAYFAPPDTASLQELMGYLDVLVQRGADINAADDAGRTPLWVGLSSRCNANLARAYQQRGADISVKTKDGVSFRDLAYKGAVSGNMECNALVAYLSQPAAAQQAPGAAGTPGVNVPGTAPFSGLSGLWRGMFKVSSPRPNSVRVLGKLDDQGSVALMTHTDFSSTGRMETVQGENFVMRLRSRAPVGQHFADGSTQTSEFTLQGTLAQGLLHGSYQTSLEVGELFLCKDGTPTRPECTPPPERIGLGDALKSLSGAIKALPGSR